MKKTEFLLPALAVFLALWVLGACGRPSAEDIKIAESKVALAMEHMNNNDSATALTFLNDALKLDPDNVDALIVLGACYTKMDKLAKAVGYLRRAVELDPGNSKAHTNLGIAYSRLGRFPEAIEEFETALKNELYRSPNVAWLNMGTTYMLYTQDPAHEAKAEKCLLKSLELDRTNCLAYSSLAELYEGRGDLRRAEKNYQAALDHCPNYSYVRVQYGQLLMRDRRVLEACRMFDKVRTEESDFNLSRRALSLYEQLGCDPLLAESREKEEKTKSKESVEKMKTLDYRTR